MHFTAGRSAGNGGQVYSLTHARIILAILARYPRWRMSYKIFLLGQINWFRNFRESCAKTRISFIKISGRAQPSVQLVNGEIRYVDPKKCRGRPEILVYDNRIFVFNSFSWLLTMIYLVVWKWFFHFFIFLVPREMIWNHVLWQKFKFESFIPKTEGLGSKQRSSEIFSARTPFKKELPSNLFDYNKATKIY